MLQQLVHAELLMDDLEDPSLFRYEIVVEHVSSEAEWPLYKYPNLLLQHSNFRWVLVRLTVCLINLVDSGSEHECLILDQG